MHRTLLLSVLLLALPGSFATAEVVDSATGGFTTRSAAKIAATPGEVYRSLVQDIGAWWSSDHTYSGDSSRLRIDAIQGGCFCENLPDGGNVRHLTVVHANPGVLLRMTGGLGPLQAEGVTGSLSWAFEETDNGTVLTVTYAVGGYVANGLDAWAESVDRVVGEQLDRLARFSASGNPDAVPAEGGD